MEILIINGPNINLIGTRQTEIYGEQSFIDFFQSLIKNFPQHQFTHFQSNIEGEIVNALQNAQAQGIVLNAAAYTHTSIAIADAIKAINIPVIEVHISNVFARELERHTSLIKAACQASISGMGLHSYTLAVHALALL